MSNEIQGVSSAGTLYARILDGNGRAWNTTTEAFETYAAANYGNYDITMTEQGNSGVYVGDFPTAIETSGTFTYYVYLQSGGSPVEGDNVVNSGYVDWTGSGVASSGAGTGAMSGSEWRTYVLGHGFKRTDKDTELFEATTDAVQEIRRRFSFSEAQEDKETTDTIGTLGEFKLDLESDFGLLLGVVLEDDDTGTELVKLSKSEYDEKYPSVNVETDRGYPRHFTIYKDQIYLGPIPDQTDYVYRISYSKRAGTISSGTVGVPFTSLYRDALLNNTLSRLYRGLDEYERADYHEAKFENYMLQAQTRERLNQGRAIFIMRQKDC